MPKAGKTNNLGRDAWLPYHALMPKEDDIEHILNSLDHLLREGFDDGEKRPAEKQETEEMLPDMDAGDSDVEEEIEVEPVTDQKPQPGELVQRAAPDTSDGEGEEGEIFDESAAADAPPDISEAGPRRLLLSEDMLDEDLSSEQSAPASAEEVPEESDIQSPETEQADAAWLEKHGRKTASGARTALVLQDEQARADLAQRVSADVAARLAEQIPLLVEESLMERLAELDPGHNQPI